MSVGEALTVGIAVLGAAIALGTLAVAAMEYVRQGRLKRADHFLSLRLRLKENDDFAKIAALLDDCATAGPEDKAVAEATIAALPFRLKRDYLGLFEEVALALNSALIRTEVAHYMFGYYAILCWENKAFWANVNKLTTYWTLLANFYAEMKAEQARFNAEHEALEFNPRKFRF